MGGHAQEDKHAAHHRLAARLSQQAEDVRRLTAGLDETALAERTVAGKWSLKELVCHLWRVQQVFEGRVDKMLSEDVPAIASWEPDGDTEFERMAARPGNECVRSFLAARERFLTRLETLSPSEWHRRGSHPEYPNYDVHFQIDYMVHHEAHHIYQMFQRRLPFGKLPH